MRSGGTMPSSADWDDLLRRRGDNVEMEFVPIRQVVERARESATSCFRRMRCRFPLDAPGELCESRIMKNQIAELRALLARFISKGLSPCHEVMKADQFAQSDTRVV